MRKLTSLLLALMLLFTFGLAEEEEEELSLEDILSGADPDVVADIFRTPVVIDGTAAEAAPVESIY